MKEFSHQDVQAAHDALRPHAQALVDRFGQAQARENSRRGRGVGMPRRRDAAFRVSSRRSFEIEES